MKHTVTPNPLRHGRCDELRTSRFACSTTRNWLHENATCHAGRRRGRVDTIQRSATQRLASLSHTHAVTRVGHGRTDRNRLTNQLLTIGISEIVDEKPSKSGSRPVRRCVIAFRSKRSSIVPKAALLGRQPFLLLLRRHPLPRSTSGAWPRRVSQNRSRDKLLFPESRNPNTLALPRNGPVSRPVAFTRAIIFHVLSSNVRSR